MQNSAFPSGIAEIPGLQDFVLDLRSPSMLVWCAGRKTKAGAVYRRCPAVSAVPKALPDRSFMGIAELPVLSAFPRYIGLYGGL